MIIFQMWRTVSCWYMWHLLPSPPCFCSTEASSVLNDSTWPFAGPTSLPVLPLFVPKLHLPRVKCTDTGLGSGLADTAVVHCFLQPRDVVVTTCSLLAYPLTSGLRYRSSELRPHDIRMIGAVRSLKSHWNHLPRTPIPPQRVCGPVVATQQTSQHGIPKLQLHLPGEEEGDMGNFSWVLSYKAMNE